MEGRKEWYEIKRNIVNSTELYLYKYVNISYQKRDIYLYID